IDKLFGGAARKIRASAEPTPRSRDHDAPHRAVCTRLLEHLPKLIEERHAERVELLRAVQRHPQDAARFAPAFGKDRLITHLRGSLNMRCRVSYPRFPTQGR